jgi:hypothetical protein
MTALAEPDSHRSPLRTAPQGPARERERRSPMAARGQAAR